MSYLASGFENVDSTHTVEKFTHCLNLLASLEFFQNYKQKTFELLHLAIGASVLEVGCGTGSDAIALAQRVGHQGKVVAVDHSQAMLAQAIEATKGLTLPIEFVKAEAQQLPFADQTFDGARVDRTLQHISDPQRAIAEMARVVRPGGAVVAMEPDWETFTLDSEARALTRRLLNFWCDSFPSGWIGRDLLKQFHHAGLTSIEVIPKTLVITHFELADQVFDLVQTTHSACEAGIVKQAEAAAWLHDLQQMDQFQEFFCSFTGFIVSGKKP
jgi:ubiquinone/menaquinone biosynthesis C-methylase UbiE